jgi:hypothetical protein
VEERGGGGNHRYRSARKGTRCRSSFRRRLLVAFSSKGVALSEDAILSSGSARMREAIELLLPPACFSMLTLLSAIFTLDSVGCTFGRVLVMEDVREEEEDLGGGREETRDEGGGKWDERDNE